MPPVMSIQAVVARIDQIAAAQQQLTLGPAAGLSAGATGAGSTTAPTGTSGVMSSSFASALSSAQTGATTGIPGISGTSASAAAGVVPGAVIPQASWNPQQKPIAGWIAPVLQWASQHGWTGSVTSGYRSYADQASINASGAYSAPAGKSNHESTEYPGGAVDVSNPGQLLSVLQGYTGPVKLVGGVLGAADPEHFSATGH
jgi:hypothetical protein